MIQYGRRIFYNKANGKILVDSGDSIVPDGTIRISLEDEIKLFPELSGYTLDDLGVLEFDYGTFPEMQGVASIEVDLATKTLIFNKFPQSDEVPLEVQLQELQAQLEALQIENIELAEALVSVYESSLDGGEEL